MTQSESVSGKMLDLLNKISTDVATIKQQMISKVDEVKMLREIEKLKEDLKKQRVEECPIRGDNSGVFRLPSSEPKSDKTSVAPRPGTVRIDLKNVPSFLRWAIYIAIPAATSAVGYLVAR